MTFLTALSSETCLRAGDEHRGPQLQERLLGEGLQRLASPSTALSSIGLAIPQTSAPSERHLATSSPFLSPPEAISGHLDRVPHLDQRGGRRDAPVPEERAQQASCAASFCSARPERLDPGPAGPAGPGDVDRLDAGALELAGDLPAYPRSDLLDDHRDGELPAEVPDRGEDAPERGLALRLDGLLERVEVDGERVRPYHRDELLGVLDRRSPWPAGLRRCSRRGRRSAPSSWPRSRSRPSPRRAVPRAGCRGPSRTPSPRPPRRGSR